MSHIQNSTSKADSGGYLHLAETQTCHVGAWVLTAPEGTVGTGTAVQAAASSSFLVYSECPGGSEALLVVTKCVRVLYLRG